MQMYETTRGGNYTETGTGAILNGLAPNGGLYMLKEIPSLDMDAMKDMRFQEIAKKVFGVFFDDFTQAEIEACVEGAYRDHFDDDEITPVKKVGHKYILELFHGPTAAFKDVALSILPRFMTVAKEKRQVKDDIVILTATSGDTGSAALEGYRNVDGIRILVFYPEDGISDVQRAQMVTRDGNNVLCCAVQGNFDDAQTGVKNIFTNMKREEISKRTPTRLSSANSINIGRLLPQTVYYIKAYFDLVRSGEIAMGEKIDFVVPTGNFGDILAGYIAKCAGLPIEKLVCASNSNDVLTEFIQTGRYDKNRDFRQTLSPSMDILVSSNLERLLYMVSGCNGEKVAQYMAQLKETGVYEIDEDMKAEMQKTFVADACSDSETKRMIRGVFETTGYLLDPHTAVAWKAAAECDDGRKQVILATASPYKFAGSVLNALGEEADGNGYEKIARLENATGTKAPDCLRGLENRPVLHTDTVAPGAAMEKYVVDKINSKDGFTAVKGA